MPFPRGIFAALLTGALFTPIVLALFFWSRGVLRQNLGDLFLGALLLFLTFGLQLLRPSICFAMVEAEFLAFGICCVVLSRSPRVRSDDQKVLLAVGVFACFVGFCGQIVI